MLRHVCGMMFMMVHVAVRVAAQQPVRSTWTRREACTRSDIYWCSAKHKEVVKTEDRILYEDLIYDYNNHIRPVFNASKKVNINIELHILQVLRLDEKNQVLVTNVWLTTEWHDERLKWDPKDYNNLRKIRLPANRFWLPDIVLYNNADDYTSGYMQTNAIIDYDGTIKWSPPVKLKSSCRIDISHFPFDTQLCYLKFGSWTYDASQVDIHVLSDKAGLHYYVPSGEWRLIDAWLKRNVVVYPLDKSSYTDVTMYICIKRRILYYVINIILPCVWLNVLSLLTFFVPPEAGEKISLGITVLLSYSVFMLLVANSMPPTSDFIPLIGIYLTFSMALTSISVIVTVWVLKLHHSGPNRASVPLWVNKLVLGHIARLVSCKIYCRGEKPFRRSKVTFVTGFAGEGRLTTRLPEAGGLLENGFQMNSITYPNRCASPIRNNATSTMFNGSSPLLLSRNRAAALLESSPKTNRSQRETPPYRKLGCTEVDNRKEKISHFKPLDDVARYLKLLVTKREQDDLEIESLNEWREVARVIDKLMFFIFFVIMISVTSWLLLVIPNTQSSEADLCSEMFNSMTASKETSAHTSAAASKLGLVD